MTGGAGYIGSVLVADLLARGFRVRVLDALYYDNQVALRGFLDHPGFEFVEGDITDPDAVRKSVRSCSDVVHLAALVGDPVCKKYPELARRVNHDASIQLVQSAAEHGIGRFVFVSTCSNYGLRNDDECATEESELNPVSLYAETKVAVERHLVSAYSDSDMVTSILRLATAHGLSPRMRFDLTVSEFTQELHAGNRLSVYDFDTWRPYCHVKDISRSIINVLLADCSKVKGQVFNVGDDSQHYTKKQLVELITRTLGRGEVEFVEKSVDPRNYRVSFQKVKDTLGFTVSEDVAASIERLKKALNGSEYSDYDRRITFYRNHEIKS